jgi:hypothetical protein
VRGVGSLWERKRKGRVRDVLRRYGMVRLVFAWLTVHEWMWCDFRRGQLPYVVTEVSSLPRYEIVLSHASNAVVPPLHISGECDPTPLIVRT